MKSFKVHVLILKQVWSSRQFICGAKYDIKEGLDQGVFDVLG